MIFYNTIIVSIEDYYTTERLNKMKLSATIFADSVAGYFTGASDSAALARLHNDVRLKTDEGEYRILVFDGNCTVISGTNRLTERSLVGSTLLVPEVINALTRRNDAFIRREERAVYAAASIDDEQFQKVGAVLLVSSAEDIFNAMDEIQRNIFFIMVAAAVVIIILVLFTPQILIAPLRRVMRAVQKMADGHLTERINMKGWDEYAQLARAFDNMTEKLQQVDKTREEFVSNVSHELKTPLSSMKVLSESLLLQESVPDGTYREFLQDITSEVDRMTNIVNGLLALVIIDQRETKMNFKQTELNRTVENIVKRLRPLAGQKGISLLLEENRTVEIDADEMKLDLAISNIVENGIKYTPDGGTVKLTVDADHQHAFVTVQDTGIGIVEEEQNKIFDRFYRVDKTRDRETGGTGLGLSISHSTVLLHNGSIRVTSKPGEGSVFTVRIPIRR